MKLYHATYRANWESIMELGLGAVQRKNWDISTVGGVFFADDMELAISFCEDAEDVAEEIYESGIVVLEVDSDCLLDALLVLDPNWKDEENPDACFLYRGVVAPEDLKICFDENIIENGRMCGMIIDRILDRKDDAFDRVGYDAREFYMACMEYGRIADGITRAMDYGEEDDVKAALKKYIVDNDYNPLICDYIDHVNWLGGTSQRVEVAAAKAFNVVVGDSRLATSVAEREVFCEVFDRELAFVDDAEKMVDFRELTKEAFLMRYPHSTEEEYEATLRVVACTKENKSLDFKLSDAAVRSNVYMHDDSRTEVYEKG